MGSQGGQKDEINVLVTGFAPFRDQHPVNPSWEIAKRLPDYLPPLNPKNPASRPGVAIPKVRILTYPEPIRVNYKVVRSLVPSLWDEPVLERNVDIAVHIGMSGPPPIYHIERRGHRTGYDSEDVDHKKLEDGEQGKRGEDWIWYDMPDVLETELDTSDVLSRWKGHSSEDMDLRISDDAGRYLCDFIYYSSLAHLSKQKRPRKVIFMHVPSDASERSIERGRDLTINLVRSIVESEFEVAKGTPPTDL